MTVSYDIKYGNRFPFLGDMITKEAFQESVTTSLFPIPVYLPERKSLGWIQKPADIQVKDDRVVITFEEAEPGDLC